MRSYPDEDILWASFKKGDQTAYYQLYQSYASPLYNYGCKFSTDKQLVKDCLQDLFVTLWERKAGLSNPASLKNYLFKAFRNTLFKRQTAARKILYAEDLHAFSFEIVLPPDVGIIEEQKLRLYRSALEKSINKLTRKQREVIYLKFYEGLSYAEK